MNQLSNMANEIIEKKLLSNKELKKVLMQLLVKTNDPRKVDRLSREILENNLNNIKEADIESLEKELSKYVQNEPKQQEEVVNEAKVDKKEKSDVETILAENYKIMGLYNDSQIEIKKLKEQLQETNDLKNKLKQLETDLSKFRTLNIEKILFENKMYSQMFKITGTNLVEVPDDDIDALYVRYKTQGITQYGKAFVANNEIIPKTYYSIAGGEKI
jgi:hypothetical protein